MALLVHPPLETTALSRGPRTCEGQYSVTSTLRKGSGRSCGNPEAERPGMASGASDD